MKKLLFTGLLVLLFSTIGFAQSYKIKEKANGLVQQLNSEIIEGDKSQGLTDAQKEQIYNIHISRLKELKQADKDGSNKDVKKEINKKYFQKIFKEVLSKDQMKARKKGKESLEN